MIGGMETTRLKEIKLEPQVWERQAGMTVPEGDIDATLQRTPGWQLFLLGSSAAILGNLIGWALSGGLLYILTSDAVVEAYTWLTVLLCWTLVPLVCFGYGLLAAWLGPNVARRRQIRLRRSVTLVGFLLGVGLWVVLGFIVGAMVTFMP
jgi:hypothetical protein